MAENGGSWYSGITGALGDFGNSVVGFGGDVLDPAGDVVSGAVDPILNYGLTEWLDFGYTTATTPFGAQYPGVAPPTPEQIAFGYGNGNGYGSVGQGGNDNTMIYLLAGGAALVGLFIVLQD